MAEGKIMRTNDRLRVALEASGVTFEEAGERIGVDTKTVERWVSSGRTPHRRNRQALAKLVTSEEGYLWPDAMASPDAQAAQSELITLFPTRASVPIQTWVSLLEGAKERIDILAYAGSFLWDSLPDFSGLVTSAAGRGTQITLLFGDPDCDAVRVRGLEFDAAIDIIQERYGVSLNAINTLEHACCHLRRQGSKIPTLHRARCRIWGKLDQATDRDSGDATIRHIYGLVDDEQSPPVSQVPYSSAHVGQ